MSGAPRRPVARHQGARDGDTSGAHAIRVRRATPRTTRPAWRPSSTRTACSTGSGRMPRRRARSSPRVSRDASRSSSSRPSRGQAASTGKAPFTTRSASRSSTDRSPRSRSARSLFSTTCTLPPPSGVPVSRAHPRAAGGRVRGAGGRGPTDARDPAHERAGAGPVPIPRIRPRYGIRAAEPHGEFGRCGIIAVTSPAYPPKDGTGRTIGGSGFNAPNTTGIIVSFNVRRKARRELSVDRWDRRVDSVLEAVRATSRVRSLVHRVSYPPIQDHYLGIDLSNVRR